MKVCHTCEVPKSPEEFFKRTASHDGLTASCKGCCSAASDKSRRANPERDAAAKRAYAVKFPEVAAGARKRYKQHNPEKHLHSQDKYRLAKYGISPEEFANMAEAQGGKCRICGTVPSGVRGLCGDHCHKTGKVRSLLCGPCNSALGLLREDPRIIYQAAAYLEGLL